MISSHTLTPAHVRELVDAEPSPARDAARVHALVLANETSELLLEMAKGRLAELWNERHGRDSAPTLLLGADQQTIKGG